ncbi:hypothetical protein QE152_g4810 [Popillia japonica]|uniref:Uncharacterized protein n=1 Tax=Popillia japonica TaxID=7064 RepID=A0AAW1MYT2_POPJA
MLRKAAMNTDTRKQNVEEGSKKKKRINKSIEFDNNEKKAGNDMGEDKTKRDIYSVMNVTSASKDGGPKKTRQGKWTDSRNHDKRRQMYASKDGGPKKTRQGKWTDSRNHDKRRQMKASVDTDHYIVKATMKQKMAKVKRYIRKKKINVEKLMTREIEEKYIEYMEQHISQIDETLDIDAYWAQIQMTINNAAEKCLGTENTTRRNDWWNRECEEAVKKKNIARQKWMKNGAEEERKEYADKRREVKKLIKEYADKRREVKKLIKNTREKWIEKEKHSATKVDEKWGRRGKKGICR